MQPDFSIAAKLLSRDDIRVMNVLMPQQAARHKVEKSCVVADGQPEMHSRLPFLPLTSNICWLLTSPSRWQLNLPRANIYQKGSCPQRGKENPKPSENVEHKYQKKKRNVWNHHVMRRIDFLRCDPQFNGQPANCEGLSSTQPPAASRCTSSHSKGLALPNSGLFQHISGLQDHNKTKQWGEIAGISAFQSKAQAGILQASLSNTFEIVQNRSVSIWTSMSCLGNSASICQPVPPLDFGGWQARTFTGWIFPNKAFLGRGTIQQMQSWENDTCDFPKL